MGRRDRRPGDLGRWRPQSGRFGGSGVVDPALLAVAIATAIASQFGDLVESLVKRAANVKDSGAILPGHGGMFDRFDAMFLAAPVMLLALWIAGFEFTR